MGHKRGSAADPQNRLVHARRSDACLNAYEMAKGVPSRILRGDLSTQGKDDAAESCD